MKYRHVSRRLFPARDVGWMEFFSRELAKADIRMLVGTYVSAALLTSLLIFALSIVFFLNYFLLYENALFYSVLISIPVGTITLSLFYMYPLLRASGRAMEIDGQLPVALYHISAAGCNDLSSFFRMLTGRGNYGALSAEADKGLHCINSLGTDARIAALKVAESTPSLDLKEFLLELSKTQAQGLAGFIRKQASRRLGEYRERLGLLERRHGAFAEGYAIFMILFPILLVSFAYNSPLLPLGVYFAVPLVNILLLVILYRLEAWDVAK